MTPSSPFLTTNTTILWLKLLLSAATLLFVYFRCKGKRAELSPNAKLLIGATVLLSFGVFHNLGAFRAGTFVHYGEMFHYYLGAKYFGEVGYDDLYNAVIVADAEQDNALAAMPFYTDLRTYQNAPREAALRDVHRIKGLFSEARWSAFKDDVAFFKQATGMPRSPGLIFLLMDHGYNASPLSTLMLGALANAVPVTQLTLLASLDVLIVAAMVLLVFRSFGFEMGAVFSVYFFVNILSGYDHVSGSLLRYDWLLYTVVAVCLLAKERYAASAFFLTLAAMLRVFPALLFFGIAVSILRKTIAARALDAGSLRFIVAAAITGSALFFLPAVSLGSVVQPWKDFAANTELHDRGVYVNHLGLRAVALFEPSHLSLERFVETYTRPHSNDIVRHWQDAKEKELATKRPAILSCSLLVLLAVAAIIWKRRENESESMLGALPLIYAVGFLSHYYYAFLCLFVLHFFRRKGPGSGFVPLCLLLLLNIGALITDAFKPSPIVFYTLINLYLSICFGSILAFELIEAFLGPRPTAMPAGTGSDVSAAQDARRNGKRRRRQRARPRRR